MEADETKIEITDDTKVSDLIGTDIEKEPETPETPETKDETKDPAEKESDILKAARKDLEDLESKKNSLGEESERLEESGETLSEEVERLEEEKKEFEELEKIRSRKLELEEEIAALNKKSLVNDMISKRKLPLELNEWALELSYEQLEQFNKVVQSKKTILDEKNNINETDDDMEAWHRKQMQSRIIS